MTLSKVEHQLRWVTPLCAHSWIKQTSLLWHTGLYQYHKVYWIEECLYVQKKWQYYGILDCQCTCKCCICTKMTFHMDSITSWECTWPPKSSPKYFLRKLRILRVYVCIYIYYRDCHGMYNSQGLYISSGFILKNKSCISFIGLNSHHGASIPSLQKPGHLRPFSPGWPRAQRRPPAKQCPYGRRSSMSKRILTIKNGV